MTPRAILTVLLLVFVAASVVYLVFNEADTPDSAIDAAEESLGEQAPAVGDAVTASADRQLIVYYFHGNKRCATCRKIEAFTEEAIKGGYREELDSGRMVWKAVNVDEPDNNHFIKDYELSTRTVVLVDVERGVEQKWTKLERVWQLTWNKEAFQDYITENTDAYLAVNDG